MSKHEHYFKYTHHLGGKIFFSDSTGPCEVLVDGRIPVMLAVKQLHNAAANVIFSMQSEDRIIQSVSQQFLIEAISAESFEFVFDKYEGKLRCRFFAEVDRAQRVVIFNDVGARMFWQYYTNLLKNHFVADKTTLEEPHDTPTRYLVGERRVFVSYELQGKDPREWVPFLPWEHTLISMDVKTLICHQHHWVPGQWDNNPKYHGFLFKEEGQETLWRNQYPQSIQSANSNHADFQIRKDQAALGEGQVARVYEDVTHTIDRLTRGIRQFHEQGARYDQGSLVDPGNINRMKDYEEALKEHLEDLILFTQTQAGCTITIEPFVAKYEDGKEEVLHDIPMAVLTFIGEETVQE